MLKKSLALVFTFLILINVSEAKTEKNSNNGKSEKKVQIEETQEAVKSEEAETEETPEAQETVESEEAETEEIPEAQETVESEETETEEAPEAQEEEKFAKKKARAKTRLGRMGQRLSNSNMSPDAKANAIAQIEQCYQIVDNTTTGNQMQSRAEIKRIMRKIRCTALNDKKDQMRSKLGLMATQIEGFAAEGKDVEPLRKVLTMMTQKVESLPSCD